MRYRKFGRTGLFVSELCLGTMTFGGEDGIWGQIGNLKQAEADRLVGSSLDAGINFIDTADVYSDGRDWRQARRQLADNIAATTIKLNEEELAMLDTVSALPAEYPGWMLQRLGEYRRKQLAG